MIRAACMLWCVLAAAALADLGADRAAELLDAGDLAAAGAHIQQQLDAGSTSNELLYQLARFAALQGDDEAAQGALTAALAAGFTDFFRLTRDPALETLRTAPVVQTVLENRATLLDDRAAADFAAISRAFPKGYTFRRVDALRLQFACAHGDDTLTELIDEAAALRAWVHAELWPEPPAPELDPWVTVILPSPEDFVRLVGASGVGGYYDPETRRLVSSDLGPSYRHELMHVFHFRRLERLGQRRPHWFTEGLAAIMEDLDPREPGFVPVGSWRTDIAKRRLAAGRLEPWDQLFARDRGRFVGHRPRAQYAQARAIGMFLLHEGLLPGVCAQFEETAEADPLGAAAITAAAGRPPAELERAFRGWLAALDTGEPDPIELGERLGLELTAGRGAGPEVVRTAARSAASRAGLRRRDVIRAVGGRPVRTVTEWYRAVTAGGPVEVRVRRGRADVTLTLDPAADVAGRPRRP